MVLLILLLAFPYLLLILAFVVGSNRLKIFNNLYQNPKNTFSVIIPFRNEALNLPELLKSLTGINYPLQLFEILLVNDTSSDNFQPIIEQFKKQNPTINLSVLNAPVYRNSSKKNALEHGIKNAQFNWIVTTDADCVVPKNWLNTFNSFIVQKNSIFISAPVKFKNDNSFLFHFQNLNFLSLVGSTVGGFGISKPFLCNGANLCYKKSTFYEVNGFESNAEIASGDDIFLLEKMQQTYPKQTHFLKSTEAIIQTNAQPTFTEFINQQIRWASKTSAYTATFSKLVGFVVFFENLLILILLALSILGLVSIKLLLVTFLLKFVIDFILILKSAIFLKSTESIVFYPLVSFLYPFFIVITAILATTKTFVWKERTFAK